MALPGMVLGAQYAMLDAITSDQIPELKWLEYCAIIDDYRRVQCLLSQWWEEDRNVWSPASKAKQYLLPGVLVITIALQTLDNIRDILLYEFAPEMISPFM